MPAVVMSESTAHDEKRQPWKEIPKRRIVSLFSAGLAGGRAHADYLFQLGMCRTRIFLGYDAVDNAHFARPQRLSEPVGEGFLASARFVEKKNLPNLLRAYAIYVKSCAADEAWPLTLLGDGDLRPRLEAMVSELGLQDLVTMPGFKQYQELPGYYRAARVFIHASTTEQWGLVVNEAMAAGLPVIVSNRCGCAPDLVRGGVNGYAFNPFDVEEMARAMMKMTKLPEDRLVTMGQESARIIAEWGPERFARGLSDATVCAREQEPLKASMLDSLLLKVLTRR
ncbi:MAG TPA: glycosyltransferase [Prosthecobacter sp.]|nr:glycosyltransferase [Prosthecobacter sp.]